MDWDKLQTGRENSPEYYFNVIAKWSSGMLLKETRRLKRIIADLQEENAILKKAAAIFAKHPK